MKLTLLQYDIVWENKKENLLRLESLISGIPAGTELVFLPEMFNTGFSMNPESLGENPGSLTTDWLLRMAVRFNVGIGGSFIIRENRSCFNRWLFAAPDGTIRKYDKRHLFGPADENKLLSKGNERIVFDFKGLRICPNICYDLRFPVWSRCRKDYDLLVNAANWPQSRREAWITLLRARAIENQCYVAGVNRIGIDGTGISYSGDSMIIGPKGEIIAAAEQDSGCLVSAEISPGELSEFRSRFPFLDDGDAFALET